jgi:polar amino acid transport system ATP-binding protein
MIELRGVHKSYGTISVLNDFGLNLPRGESMCVYGPSGCGKSTLLKIIALIAPIDAGSVILDGVETSRVGEARRLALRRKVGYSFQEGLLLPYLNVIENVVVLNSMALGKGAAQLKRDAEHLIEKMHLTDRLHHYPGQLSVGEKKRVDLVRAIVRKPSILVADEPTSNLDPKNIEVVRNTFRELKDDGTTVVYSAVNPEEANYSDRSMLMEKRLAC